MCKNKWKNNVDLLFAYISTTKTVQTQFFSNFEYKLLCKYYIRIFILTSWAYAESFFFLFCISHKLGIISHFRPVQVSHSSNILKLIILKVYYALCYLYNIQWIVHKAIMNSSGGLVQVQLGWSDKLHYQHYEIGR